MSSLASEKLERDKLNALKAKSEFDEVNAATVPAAEVLPAARAVLKEILAALDGLPGLMVDAIRGEYDETRLHYLMSDAAHSFLTGLGARVEAAGAAYPPLGQAVCLGMKPRDLLTVSRWADKHRELVTGTNMPGQWTTERTPYLREIMDSLSEHSDVIEVIFVKAVQIGATEVLYNWIGYVMHHLKNKDMLVVVPTKEFRNQKFNPRLGRVLRESSALKELVNFSSRSNKNTEDILEYGAGAKIIKAGANVGTDLSSDSVAYAACDEVDKFPLEIPGFGDPMMMIRGRQTTHTRAKALKISSPLIEETSRIWAEWQKTDMRRYHVQCPHCGESQHLEWGGEGVPFGLKWSKLPHREGEEGPPRVSHAWYLCRHNACIIEEAEKLGMLKEAGHGGTARWIAERPYVKGRRGYHLNALYAPPGLGMTWKKLADEYLEGIGDSAKMQTFKNERLGLPWKEEYDATDPLAIMARLEECASQGNAERPAWWVRSVGIDVQKDVIEVTAYDIGLEEESWAVNHWVIPGATLTDEPWDALEELLAEIRPDCGGLDSGYNADMCYKFARRRPWLFVLKGVKTLGDNLLVEDEGKRRQRLRRKRKTSVSPFLVSNAVGMASITDRLNLPVPERGKRQPKYIHFPDNVTAFDKGFFNQLTSNRKVIKRVRHRIVVEWVENTPNEAYDCWKYALAAFLLSRLDPASRERNAVRAQQPPPKPRQQAQAQHFGKEEWAL